LIEQGYVIEFKDNADLHEDISKINNQNKKEPLKQSSLLYPVDVYNGKSVELRGSHTGPNYPEESLFILS
jgi:hypothetical protein